MIGQAHSFGLGLLLGHITQLHVGTEGAVDGIDRQPLFGVHTDRPRAFLLFEDQFFGHVVGDIGGSDISGNRGGEFFTVGHFFEIGSPAADADVGVESVEFQRAGLPRVNRVFVFLDLFVQTIGAAIELVQIGQAIGIACGDVVERFLHVRRELDIDQLRKIVLQQPGHGQGREGGHQLTSRFADVTAVLDRADDAGIGTGTPHALLFQFTDQRGFGEPRRR